MKNYWRVICEIFNCFGDIAGYCWNKAILVFWAFISLVFLLTGKEDDMIICLLVFMAFDYVTGILKSVYLKKLNSKIGCRGILKKILMLIVVAVAYRLDIVLHLSDVTYNARFMSISFYLANEGLSILENVTLCGLSVPTQLKDILEQYREQKLKK